MSVFDTNKKGSHVERLAFLDPQGGVDIQRYDMLKYRIFDQLTDKQLGFFWRPEEVDILKDAKDFKDLNEHERHIFTSNLKRQILLDSVQGRAPVEAFNSIVSLPELESWIMTWTFSETIHSRSYTHIIKLICRDENLHLASTQKLLKILPTDDPDYAKIAKETEEECIKMFTDAVDQEKEWARYLFKDGSMIGLNESLLSDFVEWIANKRMKTVGLPSPYNVPQASPLPWTQKWISGGDVQVAPQETEISSYVVGGVKKDVDTNTFKGFSL
jgi:ribonucleotide reductase beta subunit family protein with ferritin-like domain